MAISGVNGARQSYRDKFTTTGILDTEKTEGEESTGMVWDAVFTDTRTL